MRRAIVLAIVAGIALTGCGRLDTDRTPVDAATPTSTPTPTRAATDADLDAQLDAQLESLDEALQQADADLARGDADAAKE